MQSRVVRIQERNELAAGLFEPKIASADHASIVLPKITHGATVPGDERGSVIGRAIVDDDDFNGTVGLVKCALNRATKDIGAVVGRNHDTHQARLAQPLTNLHAVFQKRSGCAAREVHRNRLPVTMYWGCLA